MLVACPIVVANQPDGDGHTPLDLCREYQLGDWQQVEEILMHPESM